MTVTRPGHRGRAALLLVGIVLGVAAPGTAFADRVSGIRAAVDEPVAVPGSVLMLPLTATRPGADWPAVLPLVLEDGRTLQGTVAWLEPRPPGETVRQWTSHPGPVIRLVTPTDDSSRGVPGRRVPGPWLLATLPRDVHGTITIGTRRVHPRWFDPPVATIASTTMLPRSASLDRPDPDAPFAYGRWVLLARRLHLAPPPPPGRTDLDRAAATWSALLWRIGLDRLEARSPRAAAACLEHLTRIGHDGETAYAAWVTDPAAMGRLRSILLDTTPDDLVEEALRWSDAQPPLMAWIEGASTTSVTLALANATPNEVIAQVAWAQEGEIPLAIEAPGGSVTRTAIRRPRPPRAGLLAGTARASTALRVAVSRWRSVLHVGAGLVPAVPPGVLLAPLAPPMTLAGARSADRPGVPAGVATSVQVRRREGRWEILAVCRRVPSVEPGIPLPGEVGHVGHLRGHEALTVLLGEPGSDEEDLPWPIVLSVPEAGDALLYRGRTMPEIHRRSWEDRWIVRIVLPELWLDEGGVTTMAFLRTHGDSFSLEIGPGDCVPWRIRPVGVRIDRTRWGDFAEVGLRSGSFR